MAQEATLLADLISKATANILEEYNKVGKELSALNSAVEGPFYIPENASSQYAKQVKFLEAATADRSARRLACSSRNRSGYVSSFRDFYHDVPTYIACDAAAFNTVIINKIADELDEKPEGVSVANLAKDTGLNEAKLYRVLRFLATKHSLLGSSPTIA
ncbi:hypothetical protein DL96DRAFT_1707975 [Flagelloscypha sp. PMI_526]|nr:hypothetical protein DL96DRAFT_1707975 [Flagelloscypha sp. PMI_526]